VKACLAAAAAVSFLLTPVSAFAQAAATAYASAPDLPYEAVPNFFKMPPGDAMGEMQGVATNSKGHVFAFFRGPQTRLWEFGPDGNFIKEIGKGFYGFAFAHSVRVDRHDNIWTVDEGTNVITKFSSDIAPARPMVRMPRRTGPIRRTRNIRCADPPTWPGTSRTTSLSATATATTGW